MTSKTLTVRLPSRLYSDICGIAGESGIPVSTFIRSCIEKEHEANLIESLRYDLVNKLEEMRSIFPNNDSKDSSVLIEILYLLRALVADRNPQLIQQVQGRLAQLNLLQLGDVNAK